MQNGQFNDFEVIDIYIYTLTLVALFMRSKGKVLVQY